MFSPIFSPFHQFSLKKIALPIVGDSGSIDAHEYPDLKENMYRVIPKSSITRYGLILRSPNTGIIVGNSIRYIKKTSKS
jgi:hypothetical protein